MKKFEYIEYAIKSSMIIDPSGFSVVYDLKTDNMLDLTGDDAINKISYIVYESIDKYNICQRPVNIYKYIAMNLWMNNYLCAIDSLDY